MANLPVIRSKEQIIGDLIDGLLARADSINDLTPNSVLSQFLTAVAQTNFKAYADIITMLDALSVDRAVGEALQRIARDKKVPILSGKASSGKVTITDISFTKVSSVVYAGQPAPVAGSQKIYLADASKFAETGSIFIGRKTPNVEGPLQYISVQPEGGGAYWSITLAPTSLTTKFHNVGEEIVQSQGGKRSIPSGIKIQTPQGAALTSTSFKTVSNVYIVDGETTVSDVPVVCLEIGPKGNVPKGAIKEAVGLPFDASVTNPNPFSNGQAPDTDDVLRARIKEYEQTKSKGTEAAIQLSSINVISQDDLKKVLTSAIVRYADSSAALVFDDGTGYEPLCYGVGLEQIIDEALGGEVEVQLRKKPIAQVRVKNNVVGPYSMADGLGLDIEIEGETLSHYFSDADFRVPSSATVLELANSINSNAYFNAYATTADEQTKLVLFPRSRTANSIRVIKRSTLDANDILNFPTTTEFTSRLYKNDKALYQDGVIPTVGSRLKSLWASNVSSPETIKYVVDGAPEVTSTLTDSDFQAVLAGTLLNNSASIDIWAEVFNRKMPGVTCVVSGEELFFSSNLGANSRASLEITGGTLREKIFPVVDSLLSSGRKSDYTLNKQTGQLSLTDPLIKGDRLTSGSGFTRAKFITASIPNGPTSSGSIWLVVDGDSKNIASGIRANTKIDFFNLGVDKLKIIGTSALLQPEGFDSVSVGDWLLIWAEDTDAVNYPILHNHAGYWRVESVKTGEIIVNVGDNSIYTSGSESTIPTDRIQFIRSEAPLQKFSWAPSTLTAFVKAIPTLVEGLDSEVLGSKIRIYTKTANETGEIYVAAANMGGKTLGAPIGEKIQNITSHLAFVATSDSEASTPHFSYDFVTLALTDHSANIPNFKDMGGEVGSFIEVLGGYKDGAEVVDSNDGRRVFVNSFDVVGGIVDYKVPQYMKSVGQIQTADRFFIRKSYQFDSTDSLSLIVDGDVSTKSYTLPISRKLSVSGHSAPSLQDFSASDLESSLELKDAASFYDFNFAGFKAWRQAHTTLTDGTYQVKIKSVDFGPSGNSFAVGLSYPNSIESNTLEVKSNLNNIDIVLPVKTKRTSNWGGNTSFTTSVATVGGKDVVTFTYRVGDEPDFSSSGATVNVGDIAIIDANSNFLPENKGFSGRVISATQDTFSVEIPTGRAASDSLACSSIVNKNGVVTISTASPHRLANGHRVGLYDTGVLSGGNYPLNYVGYASIVNPTTFTMAAPLSNLGGEILTATHAQNIVTVTASNHGLSVGNIIVVSDSPVLAYNGLHVVSTVISANQFQYVVAGSSASISSGRFDFQSFAPILFSSSISTLTITSGLVEANTLTAHNLVAGDVVDVSAADVDEWGAVPIYPMNSIVKHIGLYYRSKRTNVGIPPDSSTLDWEVISNPLNGRFVVNSAPTTTSFTYRLAYDYTGTGTGGSSTAVKVQGKLARALGDSAEYLAFAEVSITAQELVDNINLNYADFILASNLGSGTAVINKSTQDLDLLTSYFTGTFTEWTTMKGSNIVKMLTSVSMPIGAEIETVAGYKYQLFKKELSGADYLYWAYDSAVNQASATFVISVNFTGSAPRRMLTDGENFISLNNLQSLIGTPMFLCSYPWAEAPLIGEEVRLIAQSVDHLNRFWNKLVVSGISNVSAIQSCQYGRQLQIMSNTFGSDGSIKISGGLANNQSIALTNSAYETDNWGAFAIPYQARFGLNAGFWVKVEQTVRQNKVINLDPTTVLQAYGDGLQIVSGSGSFQTKRTITANTGSIIKIEKHGKFTALIGIDGVALGLMPVKEGDWVKLSRNTAFADWSASTPYITGAKVMFEGYCWVALQANLTQAPFVGSVYWKRLGLALSNEGTFQVVRVFGDAIWFESENTLEEVAELNGANEMAFYSYDSILPGDTLIISGISLGVNNIGRYTVVDETYGSGYYFPTASRIYTTAIPVATGGGVAIGDAFNQINVEEGKPIRLWKKIVSVVPSMGADAMVIVDTPNLMNKVSVSLAAYIELQGKLEFGLGVAYGVDSYRYYAGLIAELNRVVYGDPTNPSQYPGYRAAGTAIDIKPSVIKRIALALAIRVRTGIPFSEIRERVKTSVAGYVNTLGVGQQVSLSKVIEAASKINGVVSVVITSPAFSSTSDLIYVGGDQKAQVIDPTNDISVSVLGS